MERHVNPEDPDLYALGALDGEEKQAFEAHVRGCAECARELEAARRRVALLALAAPPAAPARAVKEALMRRAREEGARPALKLVPQPRRRAWLTPALAFAAVVFACVAAWLGWRDQQDALRIHALQAQLSAEQSRTHELVASWDATNDLLGAPGTVRVALARQPGGPQGRAGVLYNARLGRVVYAGELPAAAADKSYQLWLVPTAGAPVSLGVFSGEQPTTTLTARVSPGLAAKAFAVTVEPKGGSAGPTGPKVLVGAAG